MPDDNRASISDGSPRASARRLVPWLVFGLSLVSGAAAAFHYAQLDLTLSHYDARAHLVVSRRVIDSLTPGWRQIGAVWLPLPHLLGLPGVAWDWGYRTGYPSVGISVVALSAGLAALSSLLHRRTGSMAAALVAPALVLANPSVLYLQSTPMTEPLLLGLALVSLSLVDRWIVEGTPERRRQAGAAIVALALTRYEGWCVAAALVGVSAIARSSLGTRAALGLAPYLAAAVAGFLLLGWASTGVWFVASGFFEHDPATYHNVRGSLSRVFDSTQDLAGRVLVGAAVCGMAAAIVGTFLGKPKAAILLTLMAAAGLPLLAFYQGHPHRVRYMVPLVAAAAALAGVAVAALPARLRLVAALLLLAGTLLERPPFDRQAPMVTEAQWETPFRRGRQAVTAHLLGEYDGTPILASMGSLGHYMQETSHARLAIANFVHEGNGDLWIAALEAPERHVRWVLVEGRAEGGDLLATRAAADKTYLAAFTRVAEGGGLELYRRR